MKLRHFKVSLLATCLVLASASQAATVPGAYAFRELGNPVNQQNPQALNHAGEVVGTVSSPLCCQYYGAIFWTATGELKSASVIAPREAYFLTAINNAGQMLGNYYYSGAVFPAPAPRWTLENLPGKTLIQNPNAVAINDFGLVLGREAFYNGNGDAIFTLNTLGGTSRIARALNNPGLGVGSAKLAGDAAAHAVVWQGPTVTDLGTLGGSNSDAYAINDDNVVVGEAQTAGDAATRAVRWQGGTITDLGTLGGNTSSARAINKAGLVVGFSENAAGARRATLWNGTTAIDLNTFVPAGTLPANAVLSEAYAINDAGQILVRLARNGFNDQRGGWLMTPAAAPVVACKASYKITSTNNLVGFAVKVTVSNLGDAPLTGWNVGWTYSANPFIIASNNAKIKVSGASVKATPLAANQTIAAKGSTAFTFTSLKGKAIPTVSGLTADLGGKACVTQVE